MTPRKHVPKIIENDAYYGYCQNASCDRRGERIPRTEMKYQEKLYFCKKCLSEGVEHERIGSDHWFK